MEMSFQYHYHEVLDTIGDMFTEMFKGLRDGFAKEIEAVCQQYPMEPFKFLDPPLRLEYAEGVAMLKQAGNVLDSLFYVFDRKLHLRGHIYINIRFLTASFTCEVIFISRLNLSLAMVVGTLGSLIIVI